MAKKWSSEEHKAGVVLPKAIEVKDNEEISQDTLDALSDNRGEDE